jgi:N-acetylglucosaminyldiphosphoundecaprenol N-acetyl-beta-D-mannosaminyltransferase
VTSWILGVRLDDVPSEQRLREICEGFLDGERTTRIFTPNPEILLRAREDPGYAEVLNSADLALPDGTGVALIESLRSRHRVRRWPGIEIGALLLRIAAERGATVAFVGGSATAAERAADRWRRAAPGVRIETVGGSVMVAEDGAARPDERDLELTRDVASHAPAIVLVGLGAPKQERWIARNAGAVPSARIMIGVGGAFDMWAGQLRRAPRPIRRLGLEWVWRLVLEPRRWPRILRATIVFPVRALTDRRNRVAPPPGGPDRPGQ